MTKTTLTKIKSGISQVVERTRISSDISYLTSYHFSSGTMMEGDDERKQFVKNAPKPAQKLLEKALANQ